MFGIRSERGQGSLESVGVIVVAGVLVAAITTAMVQSSPVLASNIKSDICNIVTLGEGDCQSTETIRATDDYVPPEECVIGTSSQETESKASLIVTASSGETWLIESLGDGKSRLTRSTSDGVGIGGGFGFDVSVKVDGTKYGAALTASAEAMYKSIEGEVFYADDEDEAKAILDGQQSDDTKDNWVGNSGPLRWATDKITGTSEHEDAEHDEWFKDDGLEVGGYAGATAIYETAEVQAAEEAYLGTRHKNDGTRTDYFRAEAAAMAGVDAWNGDGTYQAAAQAGMEFLVEIDRDENGKPVAMRMTSTVMTDAQASDRNEETDLTYTSHTSEIPLASEADRDVASRSLWAIGIPMMPGINDGITDADAMGAPWEFNEIVRDFGNLANDRGFIYQQQFTEKTTTDNGFTFDAKAIAELGLGGSDVKKQTDLTDYSYWNGSVMASRPGCVSNPSNSSNSW